MFLSDSYMKSLCSKIVSDISRVQFQTGEKWTDGNFTDKKSGSGTVSLNIVLPDTEALVIKGIRFLDSSDEIVAETSENIAKGAGSIFSSTFEINITEREKSV